MLQFTKISLKGLIEARASKRKAKMFQRIIGLIIKEFKAIWNDPKSRTIIIVPPLLQLLIFSHAVTMEVRNIDLGVLDRSKSVESRELISRFENSKWFKNVVIIEDGKQLKSGINSQKLDAALEISPDFSKNIKSKKPAHVKLILDGRQTNSASVINGYVSQIISGYSNELSSVSSPVNVEIRNWYNKNLDYQWYLLVSIVTLLSIIVCLLLTALSIAREREMGTFEQLLVSPLASIEILIGKTIPPLVISVTISSLMIFIIIAAFKIPFAGSFLLLLGSMIITLLSIVGVGLFISSVCKTQQQAILGVFTFQMPAVLLSGFISPIASMPVFLQYLTYLNPLRFYMVIIKGIFFKNMSSDDVFINLIPIMVVAAMTLSLANWMFKKKLD